jgi:hypothetical protein
MPGAVAGAGVLPNDGESVAGAAGAQSISLSLIAHTNIGKTALARTLLGRDIGEVRDAPHVTTSAERHSLVETAQGDVLYLWDTPGFGDSARLARRLATYDHPIIRFLAMNWDRWRDRPLWSSQQAVRNVRDEADVVLYLVNASESPADAGYIAPELTILEWIGKPVIVLLNQLGQPRSVRSPASATCLRSMHSRAAGCRRARCCTRSRRCCRPRSSPASRVLRPHGRRSAAGSSTPRWRRSPSQSRAPHATASPSRNPGCAAR